MNKMREAVLYLILYIGIFVLSVGCFYAFHGSLRTELFSFPSNWGFWFFFMYIALPIGILIRLLYKLVTRKKSFKQSLVSIVFLIGVSISYPITTAH